jgi:hypothetical protein
MALRVASRRAKFIPPLEAEGVLWKQTKGVFDSYGLEFKNLESNKEVTMSHVLIITNTRTRTFYFCLFESVESKWKEAWKIGEQIVQTLILNDDI